MIYVLHSLPQQNKPRRRRTRHPYSCRVDARHGAPLLLQALNAAQLEARRLP